MVISIYLYLFKTGQRGDYDNPYLVVYYLFCTSHYKRELCSETLHMFDEKYLKNIFYDPSHAAP